MAKRTPTDGTPNAGRPKVHLPDPEDSGQFDPALADPIPAPLPTDKPHMADDCWCGWMHTLTEAVRLNGGRPNDTQTLPAVPPSDVQAADPPAPPDASGETPETSHTPDVAAGSGGRVGRPSTLTRPDARESVLAALGGVYNPAADPGYAIRLAEDFERLINMSQHYARLVQANVDKEPPAPKDVRALYRKLRQIAATHGIDLDDNGGGS